MPHSLDVRDHMKPIIASVALLLWANAFGQQFNTEESQKQLDATPMNNFRFIGNTLICKMDRPDDFLACNRIGDFKVGDGWHTVSSRLGKPWRVVGRPNGVIAMAYLISSTEETKAYWVIENKQNTIASIQITGNYSNPSYSFSTIQLGDSEDRVTQVLGPNHSTEDVQEIRGVLWNYAPFPITVEFVNGKVYSIRVAGGL